MTLVIDDQDDLAITTQLSFTSWAVEGALADRAVAEQERVVARPSGRSAARGVAVARWPTAAPARDREVGACFAGDEPRPVLGLAHIARPMRQRPKPRRRRAGDAAEVDDAKSSQNPATVARGGALRRRDARARRCANRSYRRSRLARDAPRWRSRVHPRRRVGDPIAWRSHPKVLGAVDVATGQGLRQEPGRAGRHARGRRRVAAQADRSDTGTASRGRSWPTRSAAVLGRSRLHSRRRRPRPRRRSRPAALSRRWPSATVPTTRG